MEQQKTVLVYERHDQDARYKLLGDICETVSAKYGTGGGNMPMVLTLARPTVCTLDGVDCATPSREKRAGQTS